MESTTSADRDRVLGALNAIHGALDVLTSASLDGFTPAELLEVLTRLEVAEVTDGPEEPTGYTRIAFGPGAARRAAAPEPVRLGRTPLWTPAGCPR